MVAVRAGVRDINRPRVVAVGRSEIGEFQIFHSEGNEIGTGHGNFPLIVIIVLLVILFYIFLFGVKGGPLPHDSINGAAILLS
ncbi:hypothetical protein D1872_216730 [compost metagenome]